MFKTIYYIKDIPPIASITQFNHALGIAEQDPRSALIVHEPPPKVVKDAYSTVEVLDTKTPFGRVRDAIRFVNDAVNRNPGTVLITAGQIEPVVAGYLSKADWVVDLYDDPLQGIRNDPISRHQLTDRLTKQLVERAQLGVNTLHIDAPNKAGVRREYSINGAPTHLIEHRIPEYTKPLRAVVAGKATLDKGMNFVADGLANARTDIHIDAYGTVDEQTIRYCKDRGVSDQIEFHGSTEHRVVREAVSRSHVGLCVLPERGDWTYHYPIKLGEYLAGGTIPLASNFPAFRELAHETGVYVEPSSEGVASGLDQLGVLSKETYRERSRATRRRGEEVGWVRVRKAFAQKCLSEDISHGH